MYHFQNISILEQTALVSMQNRVIEQWQNVVDFGDLFIATSSGVYAK